MLWAYWGVPMVKRIKSGPDFNKHESNHMPNTNSSVDQSHARVSSHYKPNYRQT